MRISSVVMYAAMSGSSGMSSSLHAWLESLQLLVRQRGSKSDKPFRVGGASSVLRISLHTLEQATLGRLGRKAIGRRRKITMDPATKDTAASRMKPKNQSTPKRKNQQLVTRLTAPSIKTDAPKCFFTASKRGWGTRAWLTLTPRLAI